MKIYCAHATCFDFQQEFYQPLRVALAPAKAELLLTHAEAQAGVINTRQLIAKAELCFAEVSYSSTGMEIELGWADALGIPIVAFYRQDCVPSTSLPLIARQMIGYSTAADLVGAVQTYCAQQAVSRPS
jgi:nucleoside 2-deoxyribosyltransferase